ncbi:tyrosine-type recombinase/integrase [Tardibacter chloracetimidivorans]|uniref:tyrosine-type recombinase/integrase n=1 Tax=Tardibacter chloracetimidivorans TaxID=1921510 RepID=UPI0009FA0CA3|nr:site-specific integrase [Tardibacter chloracetimidivorans]
MSENLYQRGEVYWLKIQVAGVVYRRSLRTRSKSVAKKRAQEERTKLEEFAVTGNERHSYKEAFLRWQTEFLPNVEPSTARRYKASARQLSPHFSALFVDQIKPATIANYVSARKKEKATDATIRRDLTALSSLLRMCVSWGWTDTNPAKLWDRSVLKESRDAINRVDQKSFDLVVSEAPPGLGALMSFLLETGMRLEEAASLERSDVKPHGRVFIKKTKTHAPRTIKLSAQARRIVEIQPAPLDSPYVFNHRDNGRYASASSFYAKIRKRAQKRAQEKGIEFKPYRLHDLRHEFAARWLEKGGGIYELSRHLGHDSVSTTERFYLRFLPSEEHGKARKRRAQN